MQLSKTAIKEFKEIYFAEFGKGISDMEANDKAIRLLNLFKTIYRPIEINNYQNVVKGSTVPSDRATLNKTGKLNSDRPRRPTVMI